jgi:hypothetical protein
VNQKIKDTSLFSSSLYLSLLSLSLIHVVSSTVQMNKPDKDEITAILKCG